MVTLQIIPDRTARNWRCDDLARALYEMYNPPLKRFTWGRWWLRYRPQEHFSFDITMDTTIRFWLTVPARWQAYAQQQLGVIWPKATIKPGVTPAGKFSASAELHQKEHSFYALATAQERQPAAQFPDGNHPKHLGRRCCPAADHRKASRPPDVGA